PRPGPFSQRTAGSTLSVAYVNEFQDYTVTDEALRDPTFLKTLIALGFAPLHRHAHGPLAALAFRATTRTTGLRCSLPPPLAGRPTARSPPGAAPCSTRTWGRRTGSSAATSGSPRRF